MFVNFSTHNARLQFLIFICHPHMSYIHVYIHIFDARAHFFTSFLHILWFIQLHTYFYFTGKVLGHVPSIDNVKWIHYAYLKGEHGEFYNVDADGRKG